MVVWGARCDFVLLVCSVWFWCSGGSRSAPSLFLCAAAVGLLRCGLGVGRCGVDGWSVGSFELSYCISSWPCELALEWWVRLFLFPCG